MKIQAITPEDTLWEQTMEYAEKSPWSAGKYLAERMAKKEFKNWERVFVVLQDKQIIAYCTFTEVDSIPGLSYYPFIGFIFVDENFRGSRTSLKLINKAMEYAKSLHFPKVYIISGHIGLYEKFGFRKIDEKKDIYGNLEQIFSKEIQEKVGLVDA